MTSLDPTEARKLIEAIVAAFSVLGGGMAYSSGLAAAQALADEGSPDTVAHRVNEGIAHGFEQASPMSIAALIIVLWT